MILEIMIIFLFQETQETEFSEPCLNDFCHILNLKNLVKETTCHKNLKIPSCIDLFLTNRPRTFQCTTTIKTGVSNFHKLVLTVIKKSKGLKSLIKGIIRIQRKKTSAKTLVMLDIKNTPLSKFNDSVLTVFDKHAPKK